MTKKRILNLKKTNHGLKTYLSLFLTAAMLAGTMQVTAFAQEMPEFSQVPGASEVLEVSEASEPVQEDMSVLDLASEEKVSELEDGEADLLATDGISTVTVMGTTFNPYRKDTGLSCSVFANAGGSAPTITSVDILDLELGKYFAAAMNEKQDRILFIPYSSAGGGQTYLMNEDGHEGDLPAFISGLMNNGKTTKKVFRNVALRANYAGGSVEIQIDAITLSGNKPALSGKKLTLNSYYAPSYNQFPKNAKRGTDQSVEDYFTCKDGKAAVSRSRIEQVTAKPDSNFALADAVSFGNTVSYVQYTKSDCAKVTGTLKMTAVLKDYWGGYSFDLPVKTSPAAPKFTVINDKIALAGQKYTYFKLSSPAKYGMTSVASMTVKNNAVAGSTPAELPDKESAASKKYGAHTDEPASKDGGAFTTFVELNAKNGADAKFGAAERFELEIVPENMASQAAPVKVTVTKKDVSRVSYATDYKAVSMLRHYANDTLTIHSEGILISVLNNSIHEKAAYMKIACPSTIVPVSYKIASDTPGEFITEKDLVNFEPGTEDTEDTFSLIDAGGHYTNARKLMFNATDTYGSGLMKKVTASVTFYTASGAKLKTIKVTVMPESKFTVDKEVSEVINLARPLNGYAYQYISAPGKVCNVPVVDDNGKTVPRYDIGGQKEWFPLNISGSKVSMGPTNKIIRADVPVNAADVQKSAFYITDQAGGTISNKYRVYMDYSGKKISFVPLISYALTRRAGNVDTLYVNYVDQNKVVSNKQKVVIKYTYAPALAVSTNRPVIYADSEGAKKEIYFYQDNILYSNERIIDQITTVELDPVLASKFDAEVLESEEIDTNPSKIYGVALKKKGATVNGDYTGNMTINLQGGKSVSVKLTVQVKSGY